jgi:RNA polymerase sigma-70 factor (ECF subfamily)
MGLDSERGGPGPGAGLQDALVIEHSWQDPSRFALLFDRHAPDIFRYIARRVGRDIVDDLVAETFVSAFVSRRSYNLAYPDARPWLYGIATHVVGSHRRNELRHFRISLAVRPEPQLTGHAEQIALDVTARTMSASLATALTALADGDRDVLLLIAWEELTYDQVARALGIPVGTVRSRLHRARAIVRHALAQSDTVGVIQEVLHHE